MNERFTLDSTVTEISENERVNKKLPLFFDVELFDQVKWPFSKMKLKNMMKMTKFPGQELVNAANFILERREAGQKITIPIWRGLSGYEAEEAANTVLIPFVSSDNKRPAILICPERENGRQKILEKGIRMAELVSECNCQAFVLNLRVDREADDMGRAIRFIRANHEKLHVIPDQVILAVFGDMKTHARKLFFHSKRIKDATHRYDELQCVPEELWIVGEPDEDVDKNGIFFTHEKELFTDAGCHWLETHIQGLTEAGSDVSKSIETRDNEGEEA